MSEDQMNQAVQSIISYGINLLAALAIFLIGKWVTQAVTNVCEKMLERGRVDVTLTKFFKDLCYAALMTFVVLAALSKLGIQTASFIAVLGAAGLAVGMALQGSLSNFAAGVLILLFRPYKVGDAITAGGVSGAVQEIQIFNTVISTPDNVKIILPNAQAMGGTITNFTAHPERRLDFTVGISYEDDLHKAKNLILNTADADPQVLKNPKPQTGVDALADNSVNLAVRVWVKTPDYLAVKSGLLEKIKLAFDQNGITIPYPQRTVRLISKGAGVD